ncbi:MAG: hypothetical protein EZS28_016161 [Streblomastix strix]|uniref:Tyr recombinase domain-containing protein n=1 Tax=Streblomastix strix TaxID=222440 RepID=A0A5J4W049_9EUKA|nr:MAG: hypothetical protein EZS28_016161 [Streblomastix strix]
MDKDGNRNNSEINSEVNKKNELPKTVTLRTLTLPEHNGPSESISSKTERMEYNDDNEQNGNLRYKLVDSETQGEHSSTINTNITTNGNDNRCITKWMGFNIGERTGNDSNGSQNLEQKISEVNQQQQGDQSYNLRPTKFRQNLKEFANPIHSDQKRQQYSSFRYHEMESIKITNKGNQTGTLNNRKTRNSDPDYSPSRSYKRNSRRTKQTIKSRRLQTKGDVFSTDMSSDEFEPNNRLILTTLQQSTVKIHINNKRTRRNSNRCSQSDMKEGTPMDSSFYPSPSSSSEEDQRRADRSNDNSSTTPRPDMVQRTGKRECSIPYAQLEQRNSGTRNIVNQEKFETPSREDMLFPDGSKARKGRRFARKILRIFNVSKRAIDMILYGQRYNTQRRYYYAIEKLKKWTQIIHYTKINLLTMKPHIIIIEVLAQFTSVNTSASSALQFLNGHSSMLSLTFDIDLKNNHMFQFTRKAISAHISVNPKYEDTWKVGILFDYWRGKGSIRNLTNIELLTKQTSLLMIICSMRLAETEAISLRHSVICEQTDKVDLRLQPKTKSGLHSHKLPKTRDRIVCPRAIFFDWLKRIDNKHGRSLRDNKYEALWCNEVKTIPAKRGQISLRLKKLLDLMGIKGKQVYSFRHSAAKQLIVMRPDETLLNTYTGHARNSKSTNDNYVFAERLKDNEVATKLSDTRGQVECNPISSTQQR